MASTLLPEIGLLVIDHLGLEIVSLNLPEYHRDLAKLHGTLRVCTIICKDWLHRSRVNLYRVVWVRTIRDLSSLQKTLETQPHICELVKDVRVNLLRHDSGVIPLYKVLSMMRSRIHHLHSLQLIFEVNIGAPVLPSPTRAHLAIGFPGVKSLSISNTSASRAIYFLRGFPRLERLICNSIKDDLNKPRYLFLGHLMYLEVRSHHSLQFGRGITSGVMADQPSL